MAWADWQAELLKNKVAHEEFDPSPNVAGWTLKCPSSLYGPLTMQASIKGRQWSLAGAAWPIRFNECRSGHSGLLFFLSVSVYCVI